MVPNYYIFLSNRTIPVIEKTIKEGTFFNNRDDVALIVHCYWTQSKKFINSIPFPYILVCEKEKWDWVIINKYKVIFTYKINSSFQYKLVPFKGKFVGLQGVILLSLHNLSKTEYGGTLADILK